MSLYISSSTCSTCNYHIISIPCFRNKLSIYLSIYPSIYLSICCITREVDPIILPPGTFVSGSGEIWMTNVQCLGSESYLIECAHQALGKHNCEHSQDVMLSCGPYGKLIRN